MRVCSAARGRGIMTDYFDKRYLAEVSGPAVDRARFIDEWNRGTATGDIANMFGIASESKVRSIVVYLRKNGYALRRRRK